MQEIAMLEAPDAGLTRLAHAVRATGYQFVTPTPATHARVQARSPGAMARDLRDVFGWSLPFRADIVGSELLGLMQAADVVKAAAGGFRSTVRFSSLDRDLFMHSAFPTTMEDAVFFGPDTYRFARAIRSGLPREVVRAVDVGCGAGPGAIVVASARPGAEVFAVDINPAALRMTRVNAAVAGVQVAACRSDLLQAVPGQFDLIVANPPYLIDASARTYRHGGGALGAGLSLKILESATDRLAPGGTLLLYTGSAIVDGVDQFRTDVHDRLARSALFWTYEEIDPDVFGEELEQGVYTAADRIAAVLLTATATRTG